MNRLQAIKITSSGFSHGVADSDKRAADALARSMPDVPFAFAGAIALMRRGERPQESRVKAAAKRIGEAQAYLCAPRQPLEIAA